MRLALLIVIMLAGCERPEAPAAHEPLREAPVDPAARADALAALDAASREAVRRSPVPVLLLPAEWSANSRVMADRGYYAVSARRSELSVAIHASDIVHAPGDGAEQSPRAHTVRGRPALVMVNDGIRSVTWEEGRTSYVVEVECYRALEDPRCTEEAFVLELAESLVAVPRVEVQR